MVSVPPKCRPPWGTQHGPHLFLCTSGAVAGPPALHGRSCVICPGNHSWDRRLPSPPGGSPWSRRKTRSSASLTSRNRTGTRGSRKSQLTRMKPNPRSGSKSHEINRIAFFIWRQVSGDTPVHPARKRLVCGPFRETPLINQSALSFKPGAQGETQNKSSFSPCGSL